MPFLEKMVSATPSAALEQLVPITDRILGSAASLVAPDCPPSLLQVSSPFTSSTLCPMSCPGFPSSLPSRLSTASTTPRWLSRPRLRLSPVIASSVAILIGSPDAIVRQPNWSLLQSWLWAPPPPSSLLAQPAAASMHTPRTATKATHLGL